MLIPQTEPGKEFMFSNPFYGELLSAIEYTARKNGYHLLLGGTQEDQSYVNVAQNRGVDGIIIVGAILLISSSNLVVTILAFIAMAVASINIFGGFLVTHRMLKMFERSSD